ncbi:MAG: hypothetical protein LBE74_02115 [Treponema sp.]|nr:hypothetical protein [Treponema sp.]
MRDEVKILAIMLATSLALTTCDMAPTSTPIPSLSRAGDYAQAHNEGTWYQIFPWSFYDSNGDGIGDLNGIAQKLDYLNDSNTYAHRQAILDHGECNNSLHVDGLWLCPIMPSPSYHKYDTKNYVDIDPTFGTLDDFRILLKKCHERGIKLIIDFVMNHASQDHEWFQKALEEVRSGRPGRYASYFNFYYGATPPENYKFKTADSNGLYSYYKWWGHPAENVWYEGSFWTGMPDLNWDSQALRDEFKEIVKFWLGMGLDGFRLDATSWPYNYRGMERFWDGVNGDEKNIELWTWFNEICKEVNPNVFLVGECWEGEDTIANYYRSGMDYFGFQFSTQNGAGGSVLWGAKGNGQDWVSANYYWNRKIKMRNPNAISVPFLSNHDQDRSAHFFMADERKMGGSLLLLAPGAPFIYYGEEIGQTSGAGFEYPDSNRRGPMVWTWPKSAGMTEPPPEWTWSEQAPNPENGGLSVDDQLKDENSLLRVYIRANNLKKKYPFIAWGDIESLNNQINIKEIAAYRVIDNDPKSPTVGKRVVVAHNTNYAYDIGFSLPTGKVPLNNELPGYSVRNPNWKPTISDTHWVSLPPYSSAIIEEE